MEVDRQLERLCERITLVEGVGAPRRSELCIMSFVALVAGEALTDHPVSASPLIREFAIPVNDVMPRDVRQRLKPFVVRIVGTNDGCDRTRVEVLRQALAGKILPRIRLDWEVRKTAARRRTPLKSLFADAVGRDLEARSVLLLGRLDRRLSSGSASSIGAAIGELLAMCMRQATTRERRAWYWNEAISLLDRLCRPETNLCGDAVWSARIARAEARLGWRAWLRDIEWLRPEFGSGVRPY